MNTKIRTIKMDQTDYDTFNDKEGLMVFGHSCKYEQKAFRTVSVEIWSCIYHFAGPDSHHTIQHLFGVGKRAYIFNFLTKFHDHDSYKPLASSVSSWDSPYSPVYSPNSPVYSPHSPLYAFGTTPPPSP